jgi:hypothetical protein
MQLFPNISGWRTTCLSWQFLLNKIIWICLCRLYNYRNITSGNYCVLCYNYCVLCYTSDQLDGFYGRCERNVVARICICMITGKDLYNPITVADQGLRRIMTLIPLFLAEQCPLAFGHNIFRKLIYLFPPLHWDNTSSVTKSNAARDVDTSSQTPTALKETRGTDMYVLHTLRCSTGVLAAFGLTISKLYPKCGQQRICVSCSLRLLFYIFFTLINGVFTELLSSRLSKLNWNVM